MQAIPQKLSYMVLAGAAIYLLAQISETVRGCCVLLSRRAVVVHSLKPWLQIVQLFCLYIYLGNIKMWPVTVAERSELSSLARTLGSWVRIPLRHGCFMCVSVYSVFVLSCV
jgi:hypothetical protein